MAEWFFKQLNGSTGAPSAPAAAGALGRNESLLTGDPFASQYVNQLHIAYAAFDATIVDVWSNIPTASSAWNQQRIDQDGNPGPLTAGPSIGTYQNQQHFCYTRGPAGSTFPRGDDGTIYDSFYDGSGWHSQQIGKPGVAIYGPFAEIYGSVMPLSPFTVSIWSVAGQQHFTSLAIHTVNGANLIDVVDAFYDGSHWHTQRLNNGGNTGAPTAFSKPFGCVFTPPGAPYLPPASVAGQQHVAYVASDFSIQDVWFDGQGGHPWAAQQLNLGGMTAGPGAVGPPCVWVVPSYFGSRYHSQQHFTYLSGNGEIWDAWYNFPANKWNLQKLNIDSNGAPYYTTSAPKSAGNPSACVMGSMESGGLLVEQHVAYRDNTGAIWDLWYDGSSQWQCRQINMGGITSAPAAIGDVSLFYYSFADSDGTLYGQLHFTWQAEGGQIWDAWYSLDPISGQPAGRG